MPYEKLTELPDSARDNLPKHAQGIYRAAYNSAEEQYDEEDRRHRVAWRVAEQKYETDEDSGEWVEKEDRDFPSYVVQESMKLAEALRERENPRFESLKSPVPPLRVLYDLAHNTTRSSRSTMGARSLHRKGATRAFGPDNKELAQRYRMWVSRYWCRGHGPLFLYPGRRGGGHERDFGSSAHGARRKMGRRQAKRVTKGRTSSGSWKTRAS